MGLLRLQDNPLVHLVSRNGLHSVACARWKVHLPAGQYVRELPVAAAHGSASQEVIAVHAAQDGARCERQPSRREMKKLFLAGIAALSVLSASAAHAILPCIITAARL